MTALTPSVLPSGVTELSMELMTWHEVHPTFLSRHNSAHAPISETEAPLLRLECLPEAQVGAHWTIKTFV